MGNEMQKFENSGKMLETVLVDGDLSGLAPEQRVSYYQAVCESLGLNPLTKPFDYLKLNGRLVLYARKDATDQLRNLNGVSITKLERETIGDIMTVTAYAAMAGRTDASTGAVSVKNLQGDALANAIMKAETKAKRRVTLSICGLGALDETEIETIRDAQPVTVTVTGEVIQAEPQKQQALQSPLRPWEPGEVRRRTTESVTVQEQDGRPILDADKKRFAVVTNLELCFAGDPHSDQKRHAVIHYLTGKPSSKELSEYEVMALHRWLHATKDDNGDWHPDPLAVKEAAMIAEVAMRDAGQTSLFNDDAAGRAAVDEMQAKADAEGETLTPPEF